MNQKIKKFLEFNGKPILFVATDGIYYVAIKPICYALNVQYVNQFKKLKTDPILSQLLSKQTMVGADKKVRQMICLPERFIYGWLFSIHSESPELLKYKRKCYDLLFDYFHGAITGRQQLLVERTETLVRIRKLRDELAKSATYKELLSLESIEKSYQNKLRNFDRSYIDKQLELFDQDNETSSQDPASD